MGQPVVPLAMGQDGAMGWGWGYGAAHGFPAYGAEMGIWGSLWLWGRDGAMGRGWGYGAACGSPGYGAGLWGCGVGTQHFAANP